MKQDINMDTLVIKKMIMECDEQLYSHKFNSEEM